MAPALTISVLKQVLTRQLLASSDDARQLWIIDLDRMRPTPFSAKLEMCSIAVEGDVPIAERGKPKAIVIPRVLGVADSQSRRVQQRDHGRQDLLPRQPWKNQITSNTSPEVWQCLAELDHMFEFG